MSFEYTLKIINDMVLEEYFCQYSCYYKVLCFYFKPTGGNIRRKKIFSSVWMKFICVHNPRKWKRKAPTSG